MKKLILAAALVAAVASPALAASNHQRAHQPTANESYAYASNTVVDNGQVVGTDPDVFIREGFLRVNNPADYAGN